MSINNKYGNEKEIIHTVSKFHEYMYNYFINNPDSHNLNYVLAGITYVFHIFDDELTINNKLYEYLLDNFENVDAEHISEHFDDFMLGIVIVIPFGGEFEDTNDIFGNLADDDLQKYIKIIKLNEHKTKLIFKPEQLLKVIDTNINFKFINDNCV